MRWKPFSSPKGLASRAGADSASKFQSTVIEDLARSAFDQLHAQASALADPGSGREPLGTVGRYILQSILGQGGLGTVYGAWDPMLSRKVAVKTLQGRWQQGGVLGSPNELILNEARAAARLSHPHIVTVFDAGTSEQGVYIAMEPLQGQDLRHMLRGGWRPGMTEVASIIRRVAEALAYAHTKGVIHCDIKPANIFMVDRRSPKVLDFGIARVSRKDGASTQAATAGSPHYLSPEQINGGTVDRRCDVYSLGVVMFELLTTQLPYTGSTVDDITHAVQNETQPLAQQLDARVPAGLSAIAAKAMARSPDDRYPSARHLAAALQEWLHSAEAGQASKSAKASRSRSTGSKFWSGVAAVALVGAAAAAVALWQDDGLGRRGSVARQASPEPAKAAVPANPPPTAVTPTPATGDGAASSALSASPVTPAASGV